MRQTIQTKSYNAIIQIPYKKLVSKPNICKVPGPPQPSPKTKTIVVPQCHGCCRPDSSSSKDSQMYMEMLTQLQEAFDVDIRRKDDRIGDLEQQVAGLKQEVAQGKHEMEKMDINAAHQRDSLISKIKDKDNQIANLKKQLQTINAQKQKLFRTKFQQLQHSYLNHQEQQNLRYSNLKLQYEQSTKKQLSSQLLRFQQQKSAYRQQINQLKLTLQHLKQTYQTQIQRQSIQLNDLQSKIDALERKLEQARDREYAALARVGEKEAMIGKKEVEIGALRAEVAELRNVGETRGDRLKKLGDQLLLASHSYGQLNGNYSKLTQQKKSLQIRLADTIKQKQQTDLQLQKLTIRTQQLQTQLQSLEQQLKTKQQPKLYQVKIQKVIDRKQYIHSLQIQIQKLRKDSMYLLEQIDQLQLILASRERQIIDKNGKIIELDELVVRLQLYIEQKERSFAWVVEREIGRDMEISGGGDTGVVYKVHPGSPGRVRYNVREVREAKETGLVGSQVAGNKNLIIQNIQSQTLLKKLSQSEQLNRAIQKKVDEDYYQHRRTQKNNQISQTRLPNTQKQ